MISANSLTAAVQGQFMFVLPWMLLAVGTLGLVGFLCGVILAAGLLGPLGFGGVLALLGAGWRVTASVPPVARRRDVAAAEPCSTSSSTAPPSTRATRRRSRATSASRGEHDRARDNESRGCGRPAAREVVDGRGLMLCPGFIDLHAHSALRTFDDPFLTPKLAQGFTTEVINPDGLAPAPVDPARRAERQAYLRPLEGPGPEEWPWSTVAEYLDALDATRPALSLVPSIGHGAVRDVVLGGGRVDPTARQLAAMRREVRLGLDAGARMLSFGLVYLPGAYAATDELVAVAEEAARAGVPLVPHVRNEGHGLLAAVDEMIDVARRSGAPSISPTSSRSPTSAWSSRCSSCSTVPPAEIDLTLRPVPLRRGQHAAREHPARLGAGGRRGGTLQGARPPRRAATDRRATSSDGLPGWENLLGTLGPDRIEIANAAAPNEDAVGLTLAAIAATARQRSGRGGARPDARVGARRDDGAPLRLRRRRARRSQRTGSSSSARTGSSARGRIRGSTRTAPRFLGRFAMRDGLAAGRGGGRAADRARGRPARARRPGAHRARQARRPRPARSRPLRRHGDVRGPAAGRRRASPASGWPGIAVWRDGAPTGARPGGVVR